MIRAIVFDFGNVVGFFDHRLASGRLAKFSSLGADEIHAVLFGGLLEHEYETGTIDTPEFLKRVREACGLRCTDEVIARAYSEIFWDNPEIYPVLRTLKGRYSLLLASNTTELHSRTFRQQFADVLKVFDGQVLSHEIGARKPSTAFYEHCQRLAGCPASECVFIDDLPANVEGARRCGWHGIVYTGIPDLTRELAALGVAISAK